jgi:hypothetical protein
MKKFAIYGLLLIAFYAQGQAGGLILDRLDNAGAGGSLFRNKVFDKTKEKVQGSPYLNDVFMSSQISGAENVFLTRYNAYTDEVEVSYDDSVFVIPKEERYGSIYNKTSDYKLQLLRYNAEKDEYIYGYLFELFTNEKVGLYKRQQIILQEAREAPNGYSVPVPPKYNQKNGEYYLKTDGNKVVPFPRNKKGLYAVLPVNENAISGFLKAEKISFKDEEDLLKLTRFLATL